MREHAFALPKGDLVITLRVQSRLRDIPPSPLIGVDVRRPPLPSWNIAYVMQAAFNADRSRCR
jgi:hypothetical protein